MSTPLFKYVPDHAGMSQLMREPMIRDVVQDFAQDALEFARSITPYSSYRQSFYLRPGEENLPPSRPTRRAVVYLATDLDYAPVVEGQFHILSRTIDYVERHDG